MAVAMELPARVLDRVERATRVHHATAEADRFAVLDTPTAMGLRRWLAAIYHFEYALEQRLFAVDEVPNALLATRIHSGLLAEDLLALGLDGGARELLAQPLMLPRLRSGPAALGWLYVVQRNTLCHATLHRALAPRLAQALRRASRYLTAHANDVHLRWRELAAYLDLVAHAHEAEIVAGAHEAFARQHLWYVEAGVSHR